MGLVSVPILVKACFNVFIEDEPRWIRIEHQVEWIERELWLMQSSLEHVEAKSERGEDEMKWAGEAREVFQDFENIIDIFQRNTACYRRRGTLMKLVLAHNHCIDRQKLEVKVENIKVQIRDVSKRRPKQHPQSQDRSSSSQAEAIGPSSSQNPPRTHEVSTAVASVIDKIDAVVSQNLLVGNHVIEIVEHIGHEFKRLDATLRNDFKPVEELDERTRAWMEEIKDVSHLAEQIFASFIRKREQRRRLSGFFEFLFLVFDDFRLVKNIKRIDFKIQHLYMRKWTFGIGDLEESPTTMNSIVRRRLSSRKYVFDNTNYFSERGWPLFVQFPIDDQLESIRRDLRLMQALIKDVDGMEEDLEKRVILEKRVKEWLDEIREVVRDPIAKGLEEEIKPRLGFWKLIASLKIVKKIEWITDKLCDISERKWIYDIGKIEGRRCSYVVNQSQQQHESSFSDGSREAQGSSSHLLKQGPDEFQKHIDSIRRELKLMCALFEDVKSMEEQNARLKVWVKQMQDIARDAQKFIDSYAHNVEQKRVGIFKRYLFTRSVVPREINRIKKRILEISERKLTYDVGGIHGRKGWSSMVAPSIPETHHISNSEAAQPIIRYSVKTFISSLSLVIKKWVLPSVQLEEKIESIKGELSLMLALLEDVGRLEILDGRLKAWVKAMKAVAVDAKAAIDSYNKTTDHKSLIRRFRVANKIELIMSKIKDISERRMAYGIELNKRREETLPPFLSKQEDIVSFYDDLLAVMAQLLSDNKHCSIISIVGMEGIGKTTLAKLIYRNSAVTQHFPCHAWVSIRSNCNVKAFLKDVEEQVLMSLQEHKRKPMGLQEQEGKHNGGLMLSLNAILTVNRYLIVLDDVSTTEVWDRLIKEFPSTLHGSRIVLTTRDINVATHADPKSVPCKLHLLSDDDSWALFTQTLTIPHGSLDQCRKMMMRCGGLPQAIVKLREQFSSEESTSSARITVPQNLNLDLKPWQETQDMINSDRLPSNLKRCLFYLGRFPAEFAIPLRRLIALWIAEGLVHQRRVDEDPPESVAERYLAELIDGNMVQVTKSKLNGAVQKCRLPFALRELWSLEAKKAASPSKICHLTHPSDRMDDTSDHIHGDITNLSTLLPGYKHVISFRSFDTREGSQPGEELGEFLDRCISREYFLLLCVLDLERVFRPEMPKAVGELVLLRYLGLRWTYLEFLPQFISELLYLQTLDVKHTSISTLPTSIWKMKQLRHLYLDESYRCRFVPRPSGYSLTMLQTLWSVFIDEDSPVNDGLDKLINLKRLGVTSRLMSSQEDAMLLQLQAVAKWVQNLEQLQSLRLKSFDKLGQPWHILLESLSDRRNLSSIYLLGTLREEFIVSGLPWALTDLTLSGSGLMKDPMEALKDLPNLRILRLFSGSFIGTLMICSSGGFPQLRILKLWKLELLEEWKVGKWALPNLRDLDIRSCKKLKMLPDELQNSRTLKLEFSDMPEKWEKFKNNLVDKYNLVVTSVVLRYQIKEKLLKLKISERRKNFLRSVASEKLQISSKECPLCGAEPESAVHLFFLCKPIKMIWFAKWDIRTDYFSNLSISDWFNHILTPSLIFGESLPNETDFMRFAVILMEKTWLLRNKVISDHSEVDPDAIYEDTCSSFMNMKSI